jgi:hypothetical protein
MKYLLLAVLITLSFVTLSQSDAVIVIDVQENIRNFQIKHTEDDEYHTITGEDKDHEFASLYTHFDLVEVYTNSEYTYDIIINKHHFTLKADLVDDILTNPEELTVECDCDWEVIEYALVLSYGN